MSQCLWIDLDLDGMRWRCIEQDGHPPPHAATACTPLCRGRYPQRVGLWRKPARSWEWRCVEHAGRTDP